VLLGRLPPPVIGAETISGVPERCVAIPLTCRPSTGGRRRAEAALRQIRQTHADASDLFSCCHPMADARERTARLMRALDATRRLFT